MCFLIGAILMENRGVESLSLSIVGKKSSCLDGVSLLLILLEGLGGFLFAALIIGW